MNESPGYEQRIAHENQRLAAILNNAPAIVWTTDHQLVIQSVSGSALRRLNVTEATLMGTCMSEFMRMDASGLELVDKARRAVNGIASQHDLVFQGRSYDCHIGPLHDVESRIIGTIGVAVDVTDQVAFRRKCNEQAIQLAHVSRLATMGETVAGIIHELGQPLSAISNYAQAQINSLSLGDSPASREELLAWSQEIAASADRAAKIMQQMRDFANPSSLMPQVTRLNSVVSDSVDLMSFEIRNSSVDLDCKFDTRDPVVFADQTQLQQVMVNLIRNSLDATSNDTAALPQLKLSTDSDNNFAEIIVEDNGCGLPEGRGVFEAFVSTKAGGLGLGLSICESIVDRHGGDLQAGRSVIGGARFVCRLPLATSDATKFTFSLP